MFDQVPEARREGVRAALAAAFGTSDVEAFERMGGGLSSALVYRVVVRGRPCVLRMVTRVTPLNDPARHFACMKIAAEAGLAPAVHHADPAAGLAITDFVPGRPLAALERPRGELLTDLAALVRRLQACTPFPPLMGYLDGINQLIAGVKAAGVLPAAADEVFERYAAIPAVYPRDPADLVSSHNDINPTNLLWDGQRLWIVDWEAAFLNDRYVDPAYICNHFVTSQSGEAAFLEAYFVGPPSAYQQARIHLMRQVCHMFFATVLLRMAAAARPALRLPAEALAGPPLAEVRRHLLELLATPEGQATAALAVLGEILANTRAPRFAEALAIVRG